MDLGKALNNFTNSLYGATDTAVNIGTEVMEKQAQIDLFNSEAQLQKDTDDFMLELQQDGQYENWGAKTSAFLTKIKDQFSDPSSPYYCRNNFTAEKFNQVLTNAENALTSKVNQMALSMQKEENVAKTKETLQYYQNTQKGQSGMDSTQTLLNLSLSNRDITPSQYHDLMDQAYQNFYLKDYQEAYDKAWRENPKASEKDIIAKVDASMTGYTVDGDAEYGKKLDLTNAKNQGLKLAKTAILQEQEDHYQQFIRTNTNLRDGIDQAKGNPAALQTIADKCESQIQFYKNLPTGYMTEERRRQLMEELHTTISLSKASSGSGSKLTEDDIDNILKDAAKTGDSYFLKGYIDSSTERDGVIKQYAIDQIRNIDPNLSDEEIEGKIEKRQFILDSSFEAFTKKLQDDPRYAGELAKYNSIVSDIKKHPDNYSNTAINYVTALFLNTITNTNIDTADHDAILKQLEDTRNLVTINKAGMLFMNKKGESVYKNGEYGYGAQALNNFDVITRDVYSGKEVFTDKQTESAVKKIVEDQRGIVGKALGITDENQAKKLQYKFERTDNNDYKSSVIWEYGDKRVKIEPVNNGKDYRIVDINTGDEISKPMTASERSEAEKKKSSTRQKLLQQEKIFTGNSELKTTATRSLSVDTIPPAVKAAGHTWEGGKHNDAASQSVIGELRAGSLEDTVKNMYDRDKKGKAAFEALNIKSENEQEYFNQLPKEERIQIILGQKKFEYKNK